MGNTNERTEIQTFKDNYDKRAMDTDPRYGKAKFYSKKNNPNEMIMTKEYVTNNLDESTSYDEMVEVRKNINHENLAQCYVHQVDQESQFFTDFYKHSTAHEYYDHNMYKEIAARRAMDPPRAFAENEVWYAANAMIDLDDTLINESIDTPHGDLQPKNVMYDDEGNIKIADNAIITNKSAYQKCNFDDGYFAPLAPELLDDLRKTKVNPDYGYSDKAETFAVGVTSLAAATGNYPEDYYDWKNKKWLGEKANEDLDGLEGHKSPEQIAFIRRCLEEDPDKRWTIGEANEYLMPYKDLARQKKLNFLNRRVAKTSELEGNDFFDDDDKIVKEVFVEQGVKALPKTTELEGNDFFDDDDLYHQDVEVQQGVTVQRQADSNARFY